MSKCDTSSSPTRDPLPPPFPVGARLRCIEGHDAYVPCVECPRDIRTHPEDWARVSGRGIEVTIARVQPGHRGTGRQLRDEDGPMCHEDGEPMLDETRDGYSVYYVTRGAGHALRMSSRCIDPGSARRWQVGGSTTRYRHGERDVRIVPAVEVDASSREHLMREVQDARRERRRGARIRRGTVSPRR